MFFNGLRVVSDPLLPRFKIVQFRFPKTMRKRILKKWAKQNTNFRQVPHHSAYVIGGHTIVMHPDEIALLGNRLVS